MNEMANINGREGDKPGYYAYPKVHFCNVEEDDALINIEKDCPSVTALLCNKMDDVEDWERLGRAIGKINI